MNKFFANVGTVIFLLFSLFSIFSESTGTGLKKEETAKNVLDVAPNFSSDKYVTSSDGAFNFKIDESGKYANIIFCRKNKETIVIPSKISYQNKSYCVYGVHYEAFVISPTQGIKSRDKIKTIKISEGVKDVDFTSICGGLQKLEKVVIPKSVNMNNIYIIWLNHDIEFVFNRPDYIFEDGTVYNADKTELCFSLSTKVKDFTVPPSVKKISTGAFNSRNVKSIDFSKAESIEEIGEDAFLHCDKITDVTIPKTVKIIGERAFGGCRSLKTITFLGKNKGLVIKDEAFKAEGATSRKILVPKGAKTFYFNLLKSSGYPIPQENIVEFTNTK